MGFPNYNTMFNRTEQMMPTFGGRPRWAVVVVNIIILIVLAFLRRFKCISSVTDMQVITS